MKTEFFGPYCRLMCKLVQGSWVPIHFLVDVGADGTVFSAGLLEALGFESPPAKEMLEGVGGQAESVAVETTIRMTRENGAPVLFHGDFAGFTDPAASDMSILGRDLTNLFAVIVDRPQDVVCLLGGNHRYAIVDK